MFTPLVSGSSARHVGTPNARGAHFTDASQLYTGDPEALLVPSSTFEGAGASGDEPGGKFHAEVNS